MIYSDTNKPRSDRVMDINHVACVSYIKLAVSGIPALFIYLFSHPHKRAKELITCQPLWAAFFQKVS